VKKGKKADSGTTAKPWSGRFREETAAEVEQFTESVSLDHRLYRQDIRGSIAHASMLARRKIIPPRDSLRIQEALREIEAEIRSGEFCFSTSLEDVHMNIESRLIEKVGAIGGKLHTARSRNDQVALDMRLYLREAVDDTRDLLLHLLGVVQQRAAASVEVILPGFTHLQKAQPVRLAHHLLAYFEMFGRDEERFRELRRRVNVMPLGAGALAGVGYPIDPDCVAGLLGFSRSASNSMDAVSDRDFLIEFCFAASLVLMHLSRWAEELILWASPAFGFVDLPDAYCTGSSMMPQKKNPDVLELIRGKAGGVFGDLQSLLVLMKGLPLTYNRDMQEDKRPLFHTVDTLKACLTVFSQLLASAVFQAERMRSETEQGFLNATDLADILVRRGLPFREAHRVVGEAVAYCLDRGKRLEDLQDREWRTLCPGVEPGVKKLLRTERVVEARASPGGTARAEVRKRLALAAEELENRKRALRRDRRNASPPDF